jgi:hypothetical protein
MLSRLSDRVDRLEFDGGCDDAGPQVIYVYGGLAGHEFSHATAGPLRFTRLPEETLGEFTDRCRSVAFYAGRPYLIVGGLGQGESPAEGPEVPLCQVRQPQHRQGDDGEGGIGVQPWRVDG